MGAYWGLLSSQRIQKCSDLLLERCQSLYCLFSFLPRMVLFYWWVGSFRICPHQLFNTNSMCFHRRWNLTLWGNAQKQARSLGCCDSKSPSCAEVSDLFSSPAGLVFVEWWDSLTQGAKANRTVTETAGACAYTVTLYPLELASDQPLMAVGTPLLWSQWPSCQGGGQPPDRCLQDLMESGLDLRTCFL